MLLLPVSHGATDRSADARALLASRSADVADGPTGLPPEFEALRWFPLPPECLQS